MSRINLSVGCLTMLGCAELREIEETLSEERQEGARSDRRSASPYLTNTFAMGLTMARVMTSGLRAGNDRDR